MTFRPRPPVGVIALPCGALMMSRHYSAAQNNTSVMMDAENRRQQLLSLFEED